MHIYGLCAPLPCWGDSVGGGGGRLLWPRAGAVPGESHNMAAQGGGLLEEAEPHSPRLQARSGLPLALCASPQHRGGLRVRRQQCESHSAMAVLWELGSARPNMVAPPDSLQPTP